MKYSKIVKLLVANLLMLVVFSSVNLTAQWVEDNAANEMKTLNKVQFVNSTDNDPDADVLSPLNCGFYVYNDYNVPAVRIKQDRYNKVGLKIETKGYGLKIAGATSAGNKFLFDVMQGSNRRFIIKGTGQVGVGTLNVPEGFLMSVGGKLIAEEVRVQLESKWPDYVFEKETYQLMPIEAKEQFTNEFKHLPSFAPDEEMNANGVAIGEGITNTVKELEEAYLYIFEMNKLLKEQQQAIVNLSEKVEKLSSSPIQTK